MFVVFFVILQTLVFPFVFSIVTKVNIIISSSSTFYALSGSVLIILNHCNRNPK